MGRVVALLAVSALVACCGLVLFLLWDAIGQPKPAEAQSRERSCPGPSRQILKERGGDTRSIPEGFAEYEPFTITADSFVVTLDASSSRSGGGAVSVAQVDEPFIRRQAFRVPGVDRY